MAIREDKKYLDLKEKSYQLLGEFKVASEKLKKGYFKEVDAEIKEIESKVKEDFLAISPREIKNSLLEFKFQYDARHISFIAKVKNMKFSNLYFDLNFYAEEFEEKDRRHEVMCSGNKDYKTTSENMDSKLIELGLHPSARPGKESKIEKFLEENNIYGFKSDFYPEE